MTERESREYANRARYDLVLVDAELALTFLDLADFAESQEQREHRLDEAKRAYDTVLKALPTLYLTTPQRIMLNQKLAMIRVRLSVP
jgi:hypothetical protein